jgi:electron transport complex protein RnfD
MVMLPSSPHLSAAKPVSWLMRRVLWALLPGILVYAWFFGVGIVENIFWCSVFSLGFEAWLLWLRQRPIKLHLADSSALVTAWLLALSLPPGSAWWLCALGSFFAIVFAKQLYGGLGFNPFNPAMVGYAALLISFPQAMTQWLIPYLPFDGVSGATPLDTARQGLASNAEVAWAFHSVALAYLAGGLLLLYWRVIRWRIPMALLLGVFFTSGLLFFIKPDVFQIPWWHLLVPSTLLAAFFIATDPVSASTTPVGQWVYGVLIGILLVMIRSFGGYPDGVAFAVLLANLTVPLLDRYTRPLAYGETVKNREK